MYNEFWKYLEVGDLAVFCVFGNWECYRTSCYLHYVFCRKIQCLYYPTLLLLWTLQRHFSHLSFTNRLKEDDRQSRSLRRTKAALTSTSTTEVENCFEIRTKKKRWNVAFFGGYFFKRRQLGFLTTIQACCETKFFIYAYIFYCYPNILSVANNVIVVYNRLLLIQN